MNAPIKPMDHAADLNDKLALTTPAIELNPVHVAALPAAEPLPAAKTELVNKPSQPAKKRRMKWIVTTLRALAAQQA